MSTVKITVHDAEALDGMPDETLIRASGRYAINGSFAACWVRPVPAHIAETADGDKRVWEVLTHGAEIPYSLTCADLMAYPVEVLYADLEDDPAPRETALVLDAHACDECDGFNPHLCPYNGGGQR